MRKVFGVALIVCLFSSLCLAQRQVGSFSCRISVTVVADENIREQIDSYIRRDLRKLGDVVVTDHNPELVLRVVGTETRTGRGQASGVVLSVVVLKPFNVDLLLPLVDDENKGVVSNLTTGLYTYINHWVVVGGPGDLREVCSQIVADVDGGYLKAERSLWEKLRKYQESWEEREGRGP